MHCEPGLSGESRRSLGSSFLNINVKPGIVFPIAGDGEFFSIGGGTVLSCALTPPGIPWLQGCIETGYTLLPVEAETFLSLIPLGVGADIAASISPRWQARAGLSAGATLGILHADALVGEAKTGFNPFISAGAGISFFISPWLSTGMECNYFNSLGLAQLIRLFLGVSYHLPSPDHSILKIQDIETESIFPILFQHYQEELPGKAVLYNRGRFTISELEVSIFVKDYMSRPTVWQIPVSLQPNEKTEIDLKALFNERILGVLEGIDVPLELSVAYNYYGKQYVTCKTGVLQIHDRSALTWEDDRKAALYISEKDPVVLTFSGLTASIIRESTFQPINQCFRMAAAMHAALDFYGLAYVADPKSPYAELSKDRTSVDFLKFPRLTLKHKAGDCDDLTILYCALLESVGVETGFITIPGHIYPAVNLRLTPDKASKIFTSIDDLIFMDEETWLPVEITMINEGFLKSWQTGAREWREQKNKGTAKLYQVHKCWEVYAPVSLLEDDKSSGIYLLEQPVLHRYDHESVRFIKRELEPKVEKLKEKIRRTKGSSKTVNSLGVLYARYGLYDEAEEQFSSILESEEYLPAMINLGKIYYLRENYSKALECFDRAHKIERDDSDLLLFFSRIYYELELYDKTEDYYKRLKTKDPELAGRYAFLVVSKKEEHRASGIYSYEREMEWREED